MMPSLPKKCGTEVGVQAVAQKGEGDAARVDACFGVVMLAREREGGIRGSAEEREINDPLDACRQRRVYRREMLLQAVGRFGSRDQKQGADAAQRPRHAVCVGIARHFDCCRAGQQGCAAGIAHDQPLGNAARRQPGGDRPADVAGRAGDSV
jgi:hypothetical protein